MKAIVLFFVMMSSLFAIVYPKVYSSLGDKIYDNAPKIEKLSKIKEYKEFEDKIDNYIKDVKDAMSLGYALEYKLSKNNEKYLKQLRELAKTNDFFVKSANSMFKKSMKTDNYELFVNIIDTGLIDLDRNKEIILEYYNANKNNIPLRGKLKELVTKKETKRKAKGIKAIQREIKERQQAIIKTDKEEFIVLPLKEYEKAKRLDKLYLEYLKERKRQYHIQELKKCIS